MRETCVRSLFSKFDEARRILLLLADDAQPTKPVRFVCAGPKRRIARPQPANFVAGGPFFESRARSLFQTAWQRKALWIDSGSHRRVSRAQRPKRQLPDS